MDSKKPQRKIRNSVKFKASSEPNSALDVLQSMLGKGNSPLAQDFKRYRLKLDWHQCVGPTIAEKCSPVGYSNGILYIWVTNATWMNQLFFARKELLKKISSFAGKGWVRDIRFTQDRRDVPVDALTQEGQQDGPAHGSPSEGEDPQRDR